MTPHCQNISGLSPQDLRAEMWQLRVRPPLKCISAVEIRIPPE